MTKPTSAPQTAAGSLSTTVAPSSSFRALETTRAVAGDLVSRARYQMSRVGPAGVAGGAAAVIAAIIAAFTLVSLRTDNNELASRIARMQHRTNAPITPEAGLTRVVAQLPTRGQIPAVLGQMLQQAQAAGIELGKGQYSYTPAAKGNIGRYEVDFPLSAQYPAVRDFIDRILTTIPAAGLHKLTIQRKTIGDTQVNADVRFVVFVREG